MVSNEKYFIISHECKADSSDYRARAGPLLKPFSTI